MVENFRWDGQVMGLEGLINHRRFEELEDMMRVRKQSEAQGVGGPGRDVVRIPRGNSCI